MSKWSEKNGWDFITLNENLRSQTGINFEAKLSDFAKNDKVTEIDVHKFIKENYPVKVNLTKEDNHNLSLLLKFYLYIQEKHDELARDSEVKYGCCESLSTPYDDSFRSRNIRNFFPGCNQQQVQFCADVVGFFPKP